MAAAIWLAGTKAFCERTEVGDHDEAFGRFAKLNKDDPSLWQVLADGPGDTRLIAGFADVGPFHSDPRFEELVGRVGLAESVRQSKH